MGSLLPTVRMVGGLINFELYVGLVPHSLAVQLMENQGPLLRQLLEIAVDSFGLAIRVGRSWSTLKLTLVHPSPGSVDGSWGGTCFMDDSGVVCRLGTRNKLNLHDRLASWFLLVKELPLLQRLVQKTWTDMDMAIFQNMYLRVLYVAQKVQT